MPRTILTHPVFGEISVSQTLRARRISILVRPDGKVSISLPYNVAFGQALQFLESKTDWIIQTQEKIAERNRAQAISVPFETRHHTLVLEPGEVKTATVKIKDGRIVVSYPFGISHKSEAIQKVIKKGVEEVWRKEAKLLLPLRMERIAKEKGFIYNSLTIRNTVSKWGSCSGRDDISLSLHLMRLPDHLIDYVLLHELCHTVYKNHGEQFNAMLDKYSGGQHRRLRKELRGYQARW